MTLMLASVTGAVEAEIAVRHGADIVDLKDVASVFGSADPAVVRATVDAVARRRPVSAVVGEPGAGPERVAGIAAAFAEAGANYVKVGLFAGPDRDERIRSLAPLAHRVKIIGVMFADQGVDEALLPVMAQSGFAGAMIDTAGKAGGGLLTHIDIVALGAFIDAARAHGLMTGLAGSLEPPDIPRLLALAPDVLGFRGALCAGRDRTGRMDPQATSAVRALIPADPLKMLQGGTAPAKVDYRVLAARGYSLDAGKDRGVADRVFVRDYVLPVRIGAYARERAGPQNVRFNVEASLLRPDHAAEEFGDVFSYDLITDAIRMIVAQEHIALVETLAERLAAVLLTYPRIASVTVRVEKLDVGPGGVGVEITRERPAEVAKVHHLYPSVGRGDPQAAT